MNIATFGCSNSSTLLGESWPDFVSKKYNSNLIRAASCGAGNSFFIEKLHHVLKNQTPDYVVIQLTESSRIVLGMASKEPSIVTNELCDSHIFKDIACYTWNCINNETNFKKELGLTVNIDKLWCTEVVCLVQCIAT